MPTYAGLMTFIGHDWLRNHPALNGRNISFSRRKDTLTRSSKSWHNKTRFSGTEPFPSKSNIIKLSRFSKIDELADHYYILKTLFKNNLGFCIRAIEERVNWKNKF